MRLGRWFRGVLVLGLAWSTAGCIPYSKAPLSDPQNAVIDTALIGTWQGGKPGQRFYVHIGAADSHRIRILSVEHDHDRRPKIAQYLAHSTLVDGQHYLNVIEQGAASPPPGYVLVHYRLDDKGAMHIALPDIGGVKAAINSGALAGRVEKGDLGDAVVTASPAATAAYLNQHQAELFGPEQTLTRLN